jgi:hypothetical protein
MKLPQELITVKITRREFLKLPLITKRRILFEQAQKLAESSEHKAASNSCEAMFLGKIGVDEMISLLTFYCGNCVKFGKCGRQFPSTGKAVKKDDVACRDSFIIVPEPYTLEELSK